MVDIGQKISLPSMHFFNVMEVAGATSVGFKTTVFPAAMAAAMGMAANWTG